MVPMVLEAESLLNLINVVQFLPSEEFHRYLFITLVAADELLRHGAWFAAHVAVSGSLLIDRVAQLQTIFDSLWTEVEELVNLLGNFAIGQLHMATPIGVDVDADGASHADSITQLHQHLIGYTGCYQVFGDVTGGIGGRTVHLRRVFTRESTTTVSTLTTIGINDNLTTRQAGIAMRATDDKLASGVNEVLNLVVAEGQHLLRMD